MKCKLCNKAIDYDTKVCPECGKDYTYEIHTKNQKKLTVFLILIIAAIVFLTVFSIVRYCFGAETNNVETTAETTEETTISKKLIYKTIEKDNISYRVPSHWTFSKKNNNNYHYNNDDNFLYFYSEPTELPEMTETVFEEYTESFIEGLKASDATDYKELSKEFMYINESYYALHLQYTCNISSNDVFLNLYAFEDDGIFYCFSFLSFGDEQCEEFNETEEKIINSIEITGEPATEKPTEKETEETTEKPTEKPTEKETEPAIFNNTSTGGWWANGTGDYVASGLTVTGYGVLHVEYYGDGYFSVKSYENDDYDDLLVSTVGSYSGDVLIDHSGTFEIVVESEGDWSITSSGLKVDDTTSFSGSGDAVTGITSHDGGNWKITCDGDDYFSVKQYGMNEGYMDLLVAETDGYSGVVKSEKGDDIFFVVSASDNWSIVKQ